MSASRIIKAVFGGLLLLVLSISLSACAMGGNSEQARAEYMTETNAIIDKYSSKIDDVHVDRATSPKNMQKRVRKVRVIVLQYKNELNSVQVPPMYEEEHKARVKSLDKFADKVQANLPGIGSSNEKRFNRALANIGKAGIAADKEETEIVARINRMNGS